MRVELSEDGWAELRDPAQLTNGQRKPLVKAIAALPTNPDGTPDLDRATPEKVLAIGETMLEVFVESWSFGPLPSDDPAILDDLKATDYDRLQHAAGQLMPQLVWSPQPGTDPTTPSPA